MEKSRASFRWTVSCVAMGLAVSVSPCFAQGNQGAPQETQSQQETQRLQETQRSQEMQRLEMQRLEIQRQQQLQRQPLLQRQQQQQGPPSPSRP